MATAPSLTRESRAAGILSRAECIPLDDSTWSVRDTLTGSGKAHRTTRTSCDCYDAQRGHRCKHQIAVAAEEDALTAYAASWDALAQPCCPMCGSPLEERQYYTGGRGWSFVEVCSGDAAHRISRPRWEDLPQC